MRMFSLELKRIVKSRRTITLLLAAFLISAAMAWLPVMYESINEPIGNGEIIEHNGLDAIAYKKELRTGYNGAVTPERLKEALREYQGAVSQYGEESIYSGEFPLELYVEKVSPGQALLGRLPEAYSDPKTGQGSSLMDISPEDLDSFYNQITRHLQDVLRIEQQKPVTQEQAMRKYAEVKTPFYLSAGYSRDAFDYISLSILIIVILSAAAVAPTFSSDYHTGADSVLRCTKNGRVKLALVKSIAALTVFAVSFVICITLHLTISTLAFGRECMETSMQMLFSVISLPALNLGQLQVALAIGGLISLLSTISFTLFLSAKCKDSVSALLIAILMCLLPIFVYTVGANWISFLLPSSGIGMQNSLLYQLAGFNFLRIGPFSVWSPYATMAAAVIEIPVFLTLAVRTYCQHQAA